MESALDVDASQFAGELLVELGVVDVFAQLSAGASAPPPAAVFGGMFAGMGVVSTDSAPAAGGMFAGMGVTGMQMVGGANSTSLFTKNFTRNLIWLRTR